MDSKPFKSRLEKAERELSETFEGKHLIGFRDDLEDIWTGNRSDQSIGVDSKKLANEIQPALRRSRNRLLTFENGVSKLQIFDGLTGGIFASLSYTILTVLGITKVPAFALSAAIFLFFTLINHGILFTKALMNLVCYRSASPREKETTLRFKHGWNKGVLSSNSTILGIVLVAIIRLVWPKGYEIGLEYIKNRDFRKNG